MLGCGEVWGGVKTGLVKCVGVWGEVRKMLREVQKSVLGCGEN